MSTLLFVGVVAGVFISGVAVGRASKMRPLDRETVKAALVEALLEIDASSKATSNYRTLGRDAS